jgi:hypothetical protein
MAKTITWSIPATPSITATPQTGGSLVDGTTYYYKVFAAYNNQYIMDFKGMSVLSNEVSFTADSTNKSVKIDWSACIGASYYNVYRTTVSGDYTTNNCVKFYCESGPTGVGTERYPTTNQTTFTDNGTKTTTTTYKYFPMGLNTDKYPYHFEPFTYGIAGLKLTGGTSGDPITFQDIYDQAVTDGFTDYCYWDGINFGLMASLDLDTPTETHFKQTNGSFTSISSIDFNAYHADSNIQFGDISYGNTRQGVSIQRMGSGYVYVKTGAYFYNCNIQSIREEDMWGSNSITINYGGFTHWQYTSGNFVGCTAYSTFNYDDYIQENMHTEVEVKIYRATRLQYGASGDILNSYGGGYTVDYPYFRMDTFKAYRDNYQIVIGSAISAGEPDYIIKVIDFEASSSTDSNKLPIVYCGTSNETLLAKVFAKTYNSILMKVTDGSGNAISGATVNILDKDGNNATDYDGDNLTLTTNSAGYIALEQISITGVTNNTITDSSKSWTTNEWTGRNVYIFNGNGQRQKIKIKSNTATTITFVKDFATNPSAGDLAGIIPEVLTSVISHIAGTGAGYGPTKWSTARKFPFEIFITKTGYETYYIKKDITAKVDETIALKKAVPLMIDTKGKVYKKLNQANHGDNRKLITKI